MKTALFCTFKRSLLLAVSSSRLVTLSTPKTEEMEEDKGDSV